MSSEARSEAEVDHTQDAAWKEDYRRGWQACCNGEKVWQCDTDGFIRGFLDAKAQYQ